MTSSRYTSAIVHLRCLVHEALECCWGIGKSKRQAIEVAWSVWQDKSGLFCIVMFHGYVPIPGQRVQYRKIAHLFEAIQGVMQMW